MTPTAPALALDVLAELRLGERVKVLTVGGCDRSALVRGADAGVVAATGRERVGSEV